MKIIFLDIDKCNIKNLEKNSKYVIFSNDYKNINYFNKLDIKPIFIFNNGAYVIDLEKNNVIIREPILKESINKIINYCDINKVKYSFKSLENDIFEIKLDTNNVNRRMIIPYYFKDYIKNIKCEIKGKSILIFNKDVSLLRAIWEVNYYLNKGVDILKIDDIYQHIKGIGYFKDMKGGLSINEFKAKS